MEGVVPVQPIALSVEQLGESGSSDDEEEVPQQQEQQVSPKHSLSPTSESLNLPLQQQKQAPDMITVKEVTEDSSSAVKPERENVQIRPVEGPKVDASMLKIMGVKEEERNIERDGQVPTIYDIDIDQLEEKPWRKPDADITDWFNFGFTEETWRQYSKAQVRMRLHLYPHGKRSNIISKPVPKERGSLNLKPVTHRPKPQPQKSFMKPNHPSSSSRLKRENHRERMEVDTHPPPAPVAWQQPPRNPVKRNPPPQIQNKLPVAPVPNIQALLPNLASFANQLPAGMPKLPPVIEKLLAGSSGGLAKTEDDGGRSRRRRSRSRERRRRRRRSRSPRRSRSRDRRGRDKKRRDD